LSGSTTPAADWVRIALAAAATAVSVSIASAQPRVAPPVRIVGLVHDEVHRPIPGVEVLLGRIRLVAVTNSAGLFSLEAAPSESTIAFRRIGYRPLLLTLNPFPLAGDTILVRLASSRVELPEVIVTAPPTKPLRYAGTTKYDDVFHRRRIGLGNLITREMIDARFGVSTAELLQGIPGIRYWNGPPKRIEFARCREPGGIMIYVDGFRQTQAAGAQGGNPGLALMTRRMPASPRYEDYPEIELLSRISPSDLEMIEVFRGASEIPGVYHWNGCAVIALWTRWNR